MTIYNPAELDLKTLEARSLKIKDRRAKTEIRLFKKKIMKEEGKIIVAYVSGLNGDDFVKRCTTYVFYIQKPKE